MTKFRGVALGAFILAALVAVGVQEGVVLRHKLGPAKKDTYDFVFASNQNMQMDGGPAGSQEMPIEISAKMKMALDYGVLDDKVGRADLAMNFTDIVWDMGQVGAVMGGQELPKEMKASGKIDNRNRITDLKTPNMGMRGMVMGPGNPFGGLFLEFPETAVKTGETWKVEMANPLSKEKKSELTATLMGEKEFEGSGVHIVSLKGTMNINGDLGEIMKGTPEAERMGDTKILMVGKVDVNGEALVEKTKGRTVSMSMLLKSAQIIEMPDMGMKMNVAGATTVKMTLAKKA